MIPSTRLRDDALTASDSGLFVFPCVPRGKVPAVRDWEHTATRDPEQIRKWWDHPAPAWNIGAAVGRSGIVVIDLDIAGDEPAPEPFAGATGGADVLARLAANAGEPIPTTWTVSTPSGGSHLYFYAPRGHELRNTAGVLGWKIISSRCGFWLVSVLFGCEPREARGPRRVRRVVP